ncbi:MAG: hypothetical protein ACXVA9_04365, partial [Bdellovibrionales bacterium]
MKSTLLISLMMAFSLQAFAEGELKNFTPGTYSLKQGKLMECGAGDFAVRDSGTNVGLGDLHGFDLKNATGSLPGDAPGDEGCIY